MTSFPARALRIALPLTVVTTTAIAQQPNPGLVPLRMTRVSEATVGSPVENTLLALNLLSTRPIDALIRPLSGEGLDSLAAITQRSSTRPARPPRLQFTGPQISLWYNTSRPSSDVDGFVWQGRGLTASSSGGIVGKVGVLEFAARPQAFVSENKSSTPLGGTSANFRHPVFGDDIDLPYQFGSGAIARVDPGESVVRLAHRGFAGGVSSETQHWGPARAFPLMRGAESGGFPRAFLETRQNIARVGGLSAQWLAGRLEASPFTVQPRGARSRLGTAAVIAVQPAAFRGFSFGGARFFHVRWEPGVADLSTLALPFKGLLKTGNPTGEDASRDYNQLLSVFARIAPPGAGIEAYGEFYREDHSADFRDLLVEPDHISAFTVGLRRVWRVATSVSSVTIETANSRISHLVRLREQSAPYVHGVVSEGHTFRGQPLAASAALGGGGWAVIYERAADDRALIVAADVQRTAQNQEAGNYLGRQTGLYGVRVGRTTAVGGRVVGSFLRLQSGFGHENATNVSLQLVAFQ